MNRRTFIYNATIGLMVPLAPRIIRAQSFDIILPTRRKNFQPVSSGGGGGSTVVFDAISNNGTSSAGTSIPNFTHTIGASLSNVVCAIGLTFSINSVTGITITVGGTSASLVSGTDSGTTFGYRQMIFAIAKGSASGAQTISVSWTGSCAACAGVISVSGGDQTTPMNNGSFTSVFQGAGGGNISSSITSNLNDLTFDWVANSSAVYLTANTQTKKHEFAAPDFQTRGQSSIGSGTGTTTHQWTDQAFKESMQSSANFKHA